MPQTGPFLTWWLFSFLFLMSASWLTRASRIVLYACTTWLLFVVRGRIPFVGSKPLVSLLLEHWYGWFGAYKRKENFNFHLLRSLALIISKKVLTSFANLLLKVLLHFIFLYFDFFLRSFRVRIPSLYATVSGFCGFIEFLYFLLWKSSNPIILPFFSLYFHTLLIFLVFLGW